MSALLADLMSCDPEYRAQLILNDLTDRDADQLAATAEIEMGTPFGMFVDDPVGFVHVVLGETMWSKEREVLTRLVAGNRVAVPSAFATGKCVHWLSMIPLADGRMVPAGDLVGTAFEVMAWQEDGTQVARSATAAWNAVEPVYRLRTTSGREVVRNAAHPLWAATAVSTVEGGRPRGTVTLTPHVRGWTPLANVGVGDLVLVPERHHAEGTQPVDPDHARLLGYLLGDGGTTDRQITFTQQDGEALDEFRAIAERTGCTLVPKRNRPFCYRLIGTDRTHRARTVGSGRWNPVLDLVDRWGLAGKGARDKRLPGWAWTLPNNQLAVVLGRLFACDAWAYTREHRGTLAAQVAITLASEGLVRDIEAAMLRLGVWGTVRHRRVRYDGGYRDAWEWSCNNRDALIRLGDVLDVPGKNHAIRRVVDAVTDRTARRRAWPHRNAPAGYRWERVTAVEALLEPQQTVAVEVDGEHTFVTSLVEHNTHIAARAVLWRSLVYPPGTSLTVTTATRFRQVQRQLWPHIRQCVTRAGLDAKGGGPVDADLTQMKVWSGWEKGAGELVDVAYGFSAPPGDEAAVQGIHAPRLLIVIDEAGGIGRIIGEAMRGLMTGDDTKMLAIGNPATDDENTWFEDLTLKPDVATVRITAYDAPQQSDEPAMLCRTCPATVPPHALGVHLVDQAWIDETIRDRGEDSPFVQSKVWARFPKGGPSRAIPTQWIEDAYESDEPDGPPWMRLADLRMEGETSPYMVQPGAWVRLGVDVAADGGDEFVIARSVGDLFELRHASSGSVNANPTDVAGKVLEEIKRAELLRARLGTEAKVRVKVDAIGVGWGVVGILEAWKTEGLHDADIVRVVVSEATGREETGTFRAYRKRDELYLAMRNILTPAGDGETSIRLRVDGRTRGQMAAPSYGTNASGKTVIESKKSLKDKGQPSPDRAEAVMLCAYEPLVPKVRRAKLIGGV